MKHYVFDTHCWVSFLSNNRFEEIIIAFIDNDVKTFTCYEQLSEFKDIHTKHTKIKKLLSNKTDFYTKAIQDVAYFFEPEKRYRLLFDYKDNFLIDIAHQTKSTLVTNDKGFKIAKKLKTPPVKIISLHQFYSSINF